VACGFGWRLWSETELVGRDTEILRMNGKSYRLCRRSNESKGEENPES